MWSYSVRRILWAVPLVWGLCTVTFFIIHLAPGDPLALYANPEISPEAVELIRKNYGLDQPVHLQYFKWLWSFLKGDFGVSFSAFRPVKDILLETIPNTLQLTFLALLFDFLIGIFLGTISAIKRNSLTDYGLTLGSLCVYSIPSFWLGLMLILIFSYLLGWLPASQMQSLHAGGFGFVRTVGDRLLHLVMPVFVLGIAAAAGTARYMRASMLEVLNQDYIRTARAKGLSEAAVILRHAMKNALIPVVTLMGLYLPFLLGGSVVVEYIFGWPGMGRLSVSAIFSRDYPVILATNFIYACLVVLGNLLSDILYAVIDPRISYR
jgi:peptide/nickel transport system permease protein